MLFYKNEVQHSPIAGTGVFAQEIIPKGAIVGMLAHQGKLATEAQYQQAQREGITRLIQSAIRWAGHYFVYMPHEMSDDYINHSENPNMLYHCGVLFARRDIKVGEELTVNYKYFLAQGDENGFEDEKTGERVDGIDPKEALISSAKELLELLESADLDTARYSDYKPL